MVPEYLIDVATRNRTVTLSGTVPSLLARDRAIRIAESIRAVENVDDRLQVRAPRRPAEEIEKDLDRAFRFDPSVDSSDIKYAVIDDRVVTLNGKVQSWQEKRVAEALARGISGVMDVENQLIVEHPTFRADDEIRKDVESRLKWDVLVNAGRVRVQVQDGFVSLNGNVTSLAEKQRARSDAWVMGVRGVDATGLLVAGDVPSPWETQPTGRSPQSRDDVAIEDAIVRAYFNDKRIVSLNPTVEVENGIVTLTGTVNNLLARRMAEQIASEIAGVAGVRNYLKVRPERQFSDNQILRNVRQALVDDPQVEHEQVNVDVVNGVVYLSGRVDTVFERIKAQHLAAAVPGVREVRNSTGIISERPYDFWPPGGFYDETERPSDEQIEQSIREHIMLNPLVDAGDVRVSVSDRVATLTGQVESLNERKTAEREAYEGGAARVVNRLRIGRE